jgi:hypothetical protein
MMYGTRDEWKSCNSFKHLQENIVFIEEIFPLFLAFLVKNFESSCEEPGNSGSNNNPN